MRAGTAAVTCAVLAAPVTAWGWSAKPAAVAAPAAVQAVRSAEAPAQASDRLFISKAQLAQAMASGTLDRPVKSLLAVEQAALFR